MRFDDGVTVHDVAQALPDIGTLRNRSPGAYHRFAEDYYEQSVDVEAVAHVFALRLLTTEVVRRLNPELPDLTEDLAEIGYPVPQ